MKITVQHPDGTIETLEGTPEELAQYDVSRRPTFPTGLQTLLPKMPSIGPTYPYPWWGTVPPDRQEHYTWSESSTGYVPPNIPEKPLVWPKSEEGSNVPTPGTLGYFSPIDEKSSTLDLDFNPYRILGTSVIGPDGELLSKTNPVDK